MSLKNVHVGDYGFDIQLTITQDGTAEDISLYTTLQIIFEDPAGNETTKVATFVTDGTNGQIKTTVDSSLLTIAGLWHLQAKVSISGTAQISSDRIPFYVLENEDHLYITVEQLKNYLGIAITNSDDDNLLSEIIEHSQSFVESYTGKKFKIATDTTKYFDVECDVYKRTLYLDNEIAQITSITNGDSTVITTSSYVTEPRSDGPFFAIKLKDDANVNWTYSTTPENAIQIVGRWGYTVSPPNDIKQAVYRLCAYFYRQKDSGVFEVTSFVEGGAMEIPMGIPKSVLQILNHYNKDFRIF